LQLVSDAEQLRTAPSNALREEAEAAVVVSPANAHSHAAIVEANQRRQNEIELSRVDRRTEVRLEYAEGVWRESRTIDR
jgi:hypothetical protein